MIRLSGPPRSFLYAWAALLALLAANLAIAFVTLGAANPIVALAIAAVQAIIVALVLMRLLEAAPLSRVFAVVGLFWLLILFGLSGVDYATRPPPSFAGPPARMPPAQR